MDNLLDMLKEANQQSLSRYIAFVLIVLFIGVSIYLVINKYTWGNYDTFALATVLGGTGTQMTNKFINSKYNTKTGAAGKPLNSNNNNVTVTTTVRNQPEE